MLPRLSCLYISADAGPFVLQSGAEGLEALLLQFPVAEASERHQLRKRSGVLVSSPVAYG